MTPGGVSVRSRVRVLEGRIDKNPDEAHDPNEPNAVEGPREEQSVPEEQEEPSESYYNSSEDQVTDSEGRDHEDVEK